MTVQFQFERDYQPYLLKWLERLKESGLVSSYKIEPGESKLSKNSPANPPAISPHRAEELLNEFRLSEPGVRVLQKIEQFKALKPNWDGYEADPPSLAAISAAKGFIFKSELDGLQAWFAAPGRSGEVLVEYKSGSGKAAEIYFEPDGSAEVLMYEQNECVSQGDLKKNYEQLLQFLQTENA